MTTTPQSTVDETLRARILDALFLQWDKLPENLKASLAIEAARLHGDHGQPIEAKVVRMFAERCAMRVKRHASSD